MWKHTMLYLKSHLQKQTKQQQNTANNKNMIYEN